MGLHDSSDAPLRANNVAGEVFSQRGRDEWAVMSINRDLDETARIDVLSRMLIDALKTGLVVVAVDLSSMHGFGAATARL